MRLAPSLVTTEEIKAQKFEQGLTLEVQQKLGGKAFNSLDKLCNKVAHLYDLRQQQKFTDAGIKRKYSLNFSTPNPKRSFPKPPNPGSNASQFHPMFGSLLDHEMLWNLEAATGVKKSTPDSIAEERD